MSSDVLGNNKHPNGGTALARSHSHSNVNKPSQDLIGLTLHQITDPIDAPNPNSTVMNKTLTEASNANTSKVDELVTETINQNEELGAADSSVTCNTSKGMPLLSPTFNRQ